MHAFLHLLQFELRWHARRVSTHLYFALFFVQTFSIMLAMGGGISTFFARADDSVPGWANAPYALGLIQITFGMLGVIITAAMLGRAVQRDFAAGIHPLFFSQPISRHAYLAARFLGGLACNTYVFLAVPLGLLIASLLPVMRTDRVGPFRLEAFAQPFLLLVLPNLLFTGAIFFMLAAHTRRMLPNYVGGIALLIGYFLSATLLETVESRTIAALLDPFGMATYNVTTRYWTLQERNTLLLPMGGLMLLNRVAWLGVGALVLAVGWWRFRFVEMQEGSRRGPSFEPDTDLGVSPAGAVARITAPARSFDARARCWQYVALTRVAFAGITRDVYFYAIVAAGLLMSAVSATEAGTVLGTPVFPTTAHVLRQIDGNWWLLLVIIAAFYAGELIWRDRDVRMQQVVDSLPVPTVLLLASRLTALAGALAILIASLMPMGMIIQVAYGYYRLQPELYFLTLFGMRLPEMLLFAGLAVAVHAILDRKHLAHLVVIVGTVLTLALGDFGLEHVLYRFLSDVGTTYSDMLGYRNLAPYYWLQIYWAGWVALLLVLARLLWVRGLHEGFAWRLRLARARASRVHAAVAASALFVVIATGSFIYYNTNVLNEYVPQREQQRRSAEYERRYQGLADEVQPRYTRVEVNLDLFPRERRAEIRTAAQMMNRSSQAIDTLHLMFDPRVVLRDVRVTGARQAMVDAQYGYQAWVFTPPLAPGDTASLQFTGTLHRRGFVNTEGQFPIEQHATWLEGTIVQPRLGYVRNRELTRPDQRRRHGLPPRSRLPPPDAPNARDRSSSGADTNGLDLVLTASTDAGQMVITSGDLVRRWDDNGRAWFRYETPIPIPFFVIAAGRWAETRESWGQTELVVHHHPAHARNVPRLLAGARAALEYCTTQFGPYPFRRLVIVERPAGNDASAYPGMVPFSEDLGFNSRIRQGDIDLPFYVSAHEVAHYWFGHQLVPARAQGQLVLSEGLTQSTANAVVQRVYGREMMRKVMRYELDRYLRGRANEGREETPLKVSERTYVHYRKGAIVFFALRELLGEDRFNGALAALLREARAGSPPFPTTIDLVRHLRAITPGALVSLLEESFERIVLYENQIRQVEVVAQDGGRSRLRVLVWARKLMADTAGGEREVPMDDLVDLVVYGAPQRRSDPLPVLHESVHRLPSGETAIEVEVNGVPDRVVLDPFSKLVDRTPADNEQRVR